MKWHGLLTPLIYILLFIVPSSFAQDKIKVEGKATGVFTKYHVFKIGDVEGHTFSMYEAKGSGTYKGMFVGDGIYVWSYEGEVLMEKQ
jgi:hypothetical protein